MELLEKIIGFYKFNRDATKAGMIPIGQLEELGRIDESSRSVYLFLTRKEKHSFKVVRVDKTKVNPRFRITKAYTAYGHYDAHSHSLSGFRPESEWEPIKAAEQIQERWDNMYKIMDS